MKKIALYFLLMALPVFSGCARHYVFQDAPPVTQMQDQKPSSLPRTSDFNFVEYSVTSSARYPLVRAMDPRRVPRSEDVNAADDVPASTWFTPRLGYKTLTPEALLKGPEEVGPPQAPLKILKAKTKGNSPGFHVEDSRGKRYLIKFDSGDYPALESTANLIANRLFWAFGYNVPEDYLYLLNPDDLSNENSQVSEDDVQKVLTFSAVEDDGRYRVTASLFIDGKSLGPIPQRGTRKGDVNDVIPHENLRVLRALRVFCAFTGNSGMRSDNSLDVYRGEPGEGHTVHYLLDFGETFGIHGIEKDRPWDGYEHFFSYQDTALRFFTFGAPLQAWEKTESDPEDPKGTFDAESFKLKEWRESTQFMPIRHARPEDDYWAAKILAGLTPDHLKALFEAARFPDPEYAEVMPGILLERRRKIFDYVFGRVSPLETEGLENGALQVKDLGRVLLEEKGPLRYQVRLFNRGHKQVAKTFWLESSEENFEVAIDPETLQRAGNYLRVEIRKESSSRSAEFHLRADGGKTRLAGVVH
jgi:hypothetical protein